MDIIYLAALVPIGIVSVLLILKYPALGAALILCFANLEGMIEFGGHTPTKFITILCVLVLIVREIINKRGLLLDNTNWLILIFACWGLFTIFWSPVQENSFSKWFSFTLQSLLYFIVLNLVSSREDLKIVLWGNIIGGTVLAIVLINSAISTNFLRNISYAGMGINLAARLTAANALLSIILYQMETRILPRVLLMLSAIISGLAIVFTLSRGAWYAVIISIITLIAVFVIRKDFRLSKAKIFIGAAAILVTIYGLSSTIISEHGASKLTDRLSSSISFEDGASNRFQIWAIGWDMFLDAPAIGHGYESFSHLFPYYLSKSDYPDAFPVMKNKTPHNSFMSVLANLGFIGMILFLLIWLSLFKQLWAYFNNHNLKTGGVAWGMALFSFLFIASMVDTSINRRYFWYISALLVLIPRFYSVHKEPEDENSILSDATRLPNVGEDHHLEGKII